MYSLMAIVQKWSTVSSGVPHDSILRPRFVHGLRQWHALSSIGNVQLDGYCSKMIHSLIWRPTWLNLETTFCSWFTSMTCIVIHLWAIGWCCVLFKEVNCNRDKSLQCDLNCLFFLSQQWYLPLDISKCKVIRITNDHTCHSLKTSTIANTTLDWVDTFKSNQ